MKSPFKKVISYLMLISLLINSITLNCYAVTNQYNDDFDEYISNYDDNSSIKISLFFNFIYKKYEIPSSTKKFFPVVRNYTINTSYNWFMPVNRTTVLVTLMRINMLIPDTDKVVKYEWTDIPDNLDPLYIDYINYAKQLGITNGTGETTFGFNENATIWQFKTFISNIENIKNISQYQMTSPIKINANTKGTNIEKLISPLIIEYFLSLPENIQNRLIKNNWEYTLVLDNIPGYSSNVIGATYLHNHNIVLTTRASLFSSINFIETLVHETGHAIDYEGGIRLTRNINNGSIIFDIEMPKMGKEYRGYATTNSEEYFACAWYWMYLKGEDYFSENYPYTYRHFLNVINAIK